MICTDYFNFLILLDGPEQKALFCLIVRYRRLCFAKWTGTDGFVLLTGPVQNALFCCMVRYGTLCFAYWTGTGRFVLLHGPVRNALFCLMDRYRNVCLLFMARNCRFPKGWNSRLPTWEPQVTIQGSAGSERLELLVPNLGTMGYHCKQLPIPKGWN